MSARLSPAASLLRNSKLFALPPPIALPVAPPSSSEISHSETATTPFPRFAAIETTEISGKSGDWGFKRPLPSRSLRNTNNPVVRLIRGIDTAEHVADFESAADHVLTLRKFLELDHPLKLDESSSATNSSSPVHRDLVNGVFRATSDNTTNLSSTAPHRAGYAGLYGESSTAAIHAELPPKLQKTTAAPEQKNLQASSRQPRLEKVKRWRYKGPSLVSISGQQFNEYLSGLGEKEKALLHDRIREEVVKDKETRSRDAGNVQEHFNKDEVTEREVQEHIRYLRNTPTAFGPIIAEMLDLPKVDAARGHENDTNWWDYGESTLAASKWGITGTPATHPSAGLSYATGTHSVNHPKYGPQAINSPVVARAVKKVSRNSGVPGTTYGVAGFIMEGSNSYRNLAPKPFEKTDGGMKAAVIPRSAWIHADGTMKMRIEETSNFGVLNDKAVTGTEVEETKRAATINAQAQESRDVRPAPIFSDPGAITRMQSRPRRNEVEDVDLDKILGRTDRR